MRRVLVVGWAALALAALAAAPAQAAFGINDFNVRFQEEDGSPATQAGAHPFSMTTSFSVATRVDPKLGLVPDEELKQLRIDQIPGLVGNPTGVPRCSDLDFLTIETGHGDLCTPENAVGRVRVFITGPETFFNQPVYNLNPGPGSAAKFGFIVLDVPITFEVKVKETEPFNISAMLFNVAQPVPLFAAELTLWGEPANPAHDGERGVCTTPGGCPFEGESKPFLTLPRACLGPLPTTFEAVSWQRPTAPPLHGSSGTALSLEGCPRLGFSPSIDASASQTAESPTGLTFELGIDDPGLTEPGGIAGSDLEKAVVTLPAGFTTNPSVAAGLGACSLAQYEASTLSAPAGVGCPESSRVGNVTVHTPLLENRTLTGSIYVAKQRDNPFSNLLTIYMTIEEPELGIFVRAAGKVDPDPHTGQLTTTFENLPQLPFSDFRLRFREGQRAPFITPQTCGDYSANAVLYPYANPAAPVRKEATLMVGAPCAASPSALPSSPGFTAGTNGDDAGSYSPFLLRLSRADGSQYFSQIKTTLPEGLLGKLAGVTYCPEAGIALAASRGGEGEGATELANPSCPSSSHVGTVTVGSGAGTEPLYVTGQAYLAGPYEGASLSLEIITPAIAGPFDLGVVAVRTALQVDPLTSQITAESDPIPTILHGLPLDVRSIVVDINRPNFTLNPTSCEPKAITGSSTSTLGTVTPLSQYFQASDCAPLKFRPTLKLSLKGKTQRTGHPAVRAVVTYPKKGAYSNIARAQVSLPHSEFLDQGNLNKVCTQGDLRAGTCPARSIYGKVKAWTPLLEKPLEGNVYLGVGFGYKLPALVAELSGQIKVLLVGKVDTGKSKGIRNTFLTVPDAPVTRFELSLKGGKKYGLLENSEDICKKTQKAEARFTAQNGKVETLKPVIANGCGKSKNTKKPKHLRHNGRKNEWRSEGSSRFSVDDR